VTFNAGDPSATFTFRALSAGSATITAQAPAGFNALTDGTNTVLANISATGLIPQAATVGRNLQTTTRVNLQGVTQSTTTMTITSNDPARLLLAKNSGDVGAASISLTLPSGAGASPDFYVQGFDSTGTATYTAAATSFGSADGTVTFAPSGIIFANAFGGTPNPLLTTPGSAPSTITVYSARLDGSGNWVEFQQVAGGLSASVDVTSSNTTVGTVAPTTVTILSGNLSNTTTFTPGTAGTTTLNVSVPVTPAGFATPASGYRTLPVTNTTPGISTSGDTTIGRDLEVSWVFILGQAPSSPLAVTVTSNSPFLKVAAAAADPGANSVVITVPAGSTNGSFYLQSLSDTGSHSFTTTAAGYNSNTASVNFGPSGVVISSSADLPSVTVTNGNTAPLKVSAALLNSTDNSYAAYQQVRGGTSVVVPIVGAPAIGTLPASVTINGGVASVTATFTATAAGSGTVSVTPPAPFLTVTSGGFFSQKSSMTVNVN
jgi:hypothetical protein